MSKPIFICLHGAWHSPSCFQRLDMALSKRGYETVCPSLPSTGSSPPTKDWSADIDCIRRTVSEYVKERDVVVLMHSFSGMTGGTALESFDKKSCEAQGWKGAVIRLVFVAAFLVPEGFQHSKPGTRDGMVEEMKVDFEAGIITVDPSEAKNMFYQDMSDAEAAELAKDLRPQSLAAFWQTTTHAAWRHIPTTYVHCVGDRPSTVAAARGLVGFARTSGQHMIEHVVESQTGHSPFLTEPDWMAALLVDLVETKGKGLIEG